MTQVDTLPAGVRLTPSGKFEVQIRHPSLHKGRAFRNFDCPVEAGDYRTRRLAELNDGVKLPELTAPTKGTQLSVMLRHYLNSDTAAIAPSDRPGVIRLQNTLQGTVEALSTTWVDDWVRSLKKERLSPGTIRKKAESLARAVDWWGRKEYPLGGAPSNPLRTLKIGYSSYTPADLKPGETAVVNVSRDRRLHDGEYELLERVIQGDKREGKERAWGKADRLDMLMLFRVIVHTGLRLREAYSLRVSDVRFPLRTIHVRTSKTDAARDIPMTRLLEGWLKAYIATRGKLGKEGLIFPFWSGDENEGQTVRRDVTISLSKRFAKLFDYAGCANLVEHDLRHEATCRWMEMKDAEGRWKFRSEEVRRITGHKSESMFFRYLSLRGSDLADRLD